MNYSLSILCYVETTVNLKFRAVTMKGTRFSTQNLLECLCCTCLFCSPGIIKCNATRPVFNLQHLRDCYLEWGDGEELKFLFSIERIRVPMARVNTNCQVDVVGPPVIPAVESWDQPILRAPALMEKPCFKE